MSYDSEQMTRPWHRYAVDAIWILAVLASLAWLMANEKAKSQEVDAGAMLVCPSNPQTPAEVAACRQLAIKIAMPQYAASCPPAWAFASPGTCHYTGDAGTDPDQWCTPGDIDPSLTADQLCAEGQTRRCKPSPAVKRAVLAAYGVKSAGEIDHRIPLCAGGTNSPRNLWPQQSPEWKRKDVVEAAACRGICHGLSLDAARAMIVDWSASYARMKGGR